MKEIQILNLIPNFKNIYQFLNQCRFLFLLPHIKEENNNKYKTNIYNNILIIIQHLGMELVNI